MDGNTLLTALALALLMEGLLPFIAPAAWRNMVSKLAQMKDGQIRFFGLCCVGVALVLLWVAGG